MPSGQFGGGRFTKGGAGSGGQPAPKRGGPPDAHQQHVVHVGHERAQLIGQAAADRAKASALIKKRQLLAKELASASGKVSKGQAGSKTAANATTSSNAPAAPAAPAAPTAQQAQQQAQSSASLQYRQGQGASLNNSAQTGALRKQIAALDVQIRQYLTAAAQAVAKARALK